jgi:hypothetical protein
MPRRPKSNLPGGATDTFARAVVAISELLAHVVLVVLLLASIRWIQAAIEYLWGHDGLVLFRDTKFAFNIEWLLNIADIIFIVTFACIGVLTIIRAYKK